MVNSEALASLVTYHTFNLDLIINAYSGDKANFAFLGGIGAGLRYGRTMVKNGDHIYLPNVLFGLTSTNSPSHFRTSIMRINLGVRTLLFQKYGIEFLAHFLPNASTIQSLGNRKIALSRAYYWTLNFVMEL